MIEIESEKQKQSVIEEIKAKLKEALTGYFHTYDGILYIYALYELAADLAVERDDDEYFYTVFDEVACHHFKGKRLLLMIDGEE